MSQYSHALRKFADTGLQLRLPVDLIPATQYGRLTNGLPVIEGELRTREGLTLIQDVFLFAAVSKLERINLLAATATIADTIYPHGYVTGQTVAITVIANDPDSLTSIALGTFNVTILNVPTPTQFTFTPGIAAVWDPLATVALVFAQAEGSGPIQTLAQTVITNIFRLNQSLPAIPSDQLVAMAGRLFKANLNPAPATLVSDNIIALNVNDLGGGNFQILLTLAGPHTVPYGSLATLAGLTTTTALNGVNFFPGPSPGAPDRTDLFVGAVPGPAVGGHPETGTVSTVIPSPPSFIELVLASTAGNSPLVQNGFSGRPLSIVSFRFTDDPASWAIIADQNLMAKFREDTGGNYFFFHLGNPTPITGATFTAGGAGVLNSTGGTPYDWRYTYYDGIVNTEGNPSPIAGSFTAGDHYPGSFTNPDPVIDHNPVANPGNCIDGTDTNITLVSGNAIGVDFPKPHLTTTTTSVRYFNFPAITADVLTISIDYSVAVSGGGTLTAVADYSIDNGSSWTTYLSKSTNTVRNRFTFALPAGVDSTITMLRLYVTMSHQVDGSEIDFRVWDLKLVGGTAFAPLTLALVNQTAIVCVADPGPLNDGRVTGIRLYRRGGSLPDNWRLVGTFSIAGLSAGACGAGFFSITDNVSDTTLSASPILQLDNDPPITSINTANQPLNFIWGPVGLEARLLGCGDPNRPECVYFSKPGNPDAWPPNNFVEVSEPGTPIIAGCVYNNQTFAFSRERIYQLIEGYIAGVTFTPFQTPSAHGLFAAQGLAVGPAMYFVSKDGIYETVGGVEASMVENSIKPIFPTYDTPGQDVEGYEAVDMTLPDAIRLRYHNDEVYFCYIGRTTGTRQMLIYDIQKKRWRPAHYSTGISEVYSQPDIISSLLLGTNAGAYYAAGGAQDPFELDNIENVSIGLAPAIGVTLLAGSYFVRVSRLTSVGEVALSNEVPGIAVDATHGIQVIFPNAPDGTLSWRVYYGLTLGAENQFQQFSEATVAGFPARTTVIIAAGTAGAVPQANADHNIVVNVRTGANDEGIPLNRKQYGNVIFDLDPGGATVSAPVTITPFINGEVASEAAIQVTGSGRQQVPLDLNDFFAFNVEYQVEWERTPLSDGTITDPVLFQYDTLWFAESVGVKHWACQPTSFGFPGYMHCRDAYISIRSTAPVTLTMTLDNGIVQTYTLPSTGGVRLKQYVQFDSNKALLYTFALDSDEEFRLYEADLEVRVKPFLGVLGYAIQRPLGGEVNA